MFDYLLYLSQRHPHGGGGAGPRSIPPRQSQGGHSGARGPSHGYGEGRGAQYYPKGKLARLKLFRYISLLEFDSSLLVHQCRHIDIKRHINVKKKKDCECELNSS